MIRRWHLVVLIVLGALTLACQQGAGGATPAPSGSAKGYPSSMAALGDSITAGFGSCGAFLICFKNSWSTGTSSQVDSHYARILARNPAIKGHAHEFAQPGAVAAALPAQADRAVAMKAQYVTVLIGANDACGGGVTAMTPVTDFRDSVDAALAKIRKALPRSLVLVASIPDVYRLWQVGHTDAGAVRVWSRFHICPAMLAAPTSTAPADDSRRRAVRDRINDYDAALQEACRSYGKHCRWDGGSVHEVQYSLDLVNHFDYFHPNAEGQRELADVTYPGRFTW
ncbi:GDSL-type esterase/lipase family protein [Actinoplanes subtropicus]|uniref:GDSL-type esterase/lipase family protein n=1 Tax=Actinoplanes subtropicus TaxID=543632 RepID=UPI0004C2B54B|nr:GDSL-type esterase/lipase family protein [Actinoplanes subtropicus]